MAQNWKKLFTHIEYRAGEVNREGLVNQFQILTPKYLLPSQWVPVLLPIYSLPQRSDFLFTLYQGVVRNLFDNVTQFRSGTEIAPKSLFVCEQSPIWYGFRVGAKAIRCMVNIAL